MESAKLVVFRLHLEFLPSPLETNEKQGEGEKLILISLRARGKA
jgi:hypothetical protein